MRVIYEPRGRAKEYSALACNWYIGCVHGCKYCFAPGCVRKKPEDWQAEVALRANVVEFFRKDAEEMHNNRDTRSILFSFIGDPYQPIEEKHRITRRILRIVEEFKLNSKILTKGAYDLVKQDFTLIKRAKTEFGMTVCFVDDLLREQWEPNASSVDDRFKLLEEAHNLEIPTWISLEPVIVPEQALAVIRRAAPYVDFWKVGKINHMKAIENQVDWRKFYNNVVDLLDGLGAKYYIKEDLRKFQQT